MTYVQRKFYFPVEMYGDLCLQAKMQGVRITDLLRTYTEQGLRKDVQMKKKNTGGLSRLVRLGKTLRWKGPNNLAKNHTQFAAEAGEADLQRIYDYYR
ncbi:hypothetical protein HY947_05700 [Candidatus Gottesmanbacteria bacterium]|nr:hypothetical protein [Candidatus Gottesmanbacteria bacterium]